MEEELCNKEIIKERLIEEDKIFRKRCKGCSKFKNNHCLDCNGEKKDCNFFKEAAKEK